MMKLKIMTEFIIFLENRFSEEKIKKNINVSKRRLNYENTHQHLMDMNHDEWRS